MDEMMNYIFQSIKRVDIVSAHQYKMNKQIKIGCVVLGVVIGIVREQAKEIKGLKNDIESLKSNTTMEGE